MAHYLRSLGYAVDETAVRTDAGLFDVQTFSDPSTDTIIARARLTEITLTRRYTLAETGVYAASPVHVSRIAGDL